MGIKFWIKRFSFVFLIVLVVLSLVRLLKGDSFADAIVFSLIWSTISSAVFVGSRLYQSSKNRECVICNDTPESNRPDK